MRISDWSSDVCSSDLFSASWARSTLHPYQGGHGGGGRRSPRTARWPQGTPRRGWWRASARLGPAHGRPVYTPSHALKGCRQIGRASCRGRVCQSVEISVGAGSLQKQSKHGYTFEFIDTTNTRRKSNKKRN